MDSLLSESIRIVVELFFELGMEKGCTILLNGGILVLPIGGRDRCRIIYVSMRVIIWDYQGFVLWGLFRSWLTMDNYI